MSDTTSADDRVISHTLAYMRRLDRRQDELLELVLRQHDLLVRLDRKIDETSHDGRTSISRLEQKMDEGFASLHRDINELRSDLILMENRVLSRVNAEYDLSSRMSRLEDEWLRLSPTKPSPDEKVE